MLPFPDIKMRGNGQARNDVGIRTLSCRPNLDDFVMRWQHAQLRGPSITQSGRQKTFVTQIKLSYGTKVSYMKMVVDPMPMIPGLQDLL